MKNNMTIVTVALLLAWSGPAAAQDEEQDSMTVIPVETWTCNYRDGKGPADLDKVIAGWNKWMDEEGVDTYAAATVTPWYYGEGAFDVGWIGYWTDGNSMGAGTDRYLASGGDEAAGFAEVVACDTHSQFASTMIKAPGDNTLADDFVLYFSDCDIRDGADWDAVMDGLQAWGEYMTEQEYGNGLWAMFPAFGSGDMDFDFKYVAAYDSHTTAGAGWEKYGNGGGWEKRLELLGDKIDCDVNRVYNARVVRSMPGETDGD